MSYLFLALFVVLSVFAIERTVDVVVAIRRGYFKPIFGGCVILVTYFPLVCVTLALVFGV